VRIRLSTAELKEAEQLLHRVEHLRRIVAWADALKEELGPVPEAPDGDRKRFEETLELTHKVLSDQDHPDEGDRVRSAVDPEARMGKHRSYYNGYWGRWRVGVQCLLLGMGVNIKRMIKLLCPKFSVVTCQVA
jgi:hypothetical protein